MINTVLREIKDVHSVSVKEGKLLCSLARRCSGDVIVEIGSWKGYSTIWLAKGSQEGNHARIYAIDPHTGSEAHHKRYGAINTFDTFTSNILRARVSSIVIPLVTASIEAEKNWGDTTISLLWIDGDHEDVYADYYRWYPHLAASGIIALHDTVAWSSMRPYKLAIKEIYKSGNFTDIRRVGSITYARKVANLSYWMKVKNEVALLKRYAYQFLIPLYNSVMTLTGKCLGRTE